MFHLTKENLQYYEQVIYFIKLYNEDSGTKVQLICFVLSPLEIEKSCT